MEINLLFFLISCSSAVSTFVSAYLHTNILGKFLKQSLGARAMLRPIKPLLVMLGSQIRMSDSDSAPELSIQFPGKAGDNGIMKEVWELSLPVHLPIHFLNKSMNK